MFKASYSTHVKPIKTENRLKIDQLEINKILAEGALSFDNSVNLRNTTKQLEIIKKSLETISEVNEARVLYFKAKIQLNHYQIDSKKIVEKMLHLIEIT